MAETKSTEGFDEGCCTKCHSSVSVPPDYDEPEHGLCHPCASDEVTTLRAKLAQADAEQTVWVAKHRLEVARRVGYQKALVVVEAELDKAEAERDRLNQECTQNWIDGQEVERALTAELANTKRRLAEIEDELEAQLRLKMGDDVVDESLAILRGPRK